MRPLAFLKRGLFLVVAIVTVAVGWSTPILAHPDAYLSKEIRGQVVDAETGAPLAGVLVVADWQLYELQPEGHYGGHLKVIEALTDDNGFYSIESWGPAIRPPSAFLDAAPHVVFFKSGYFPVSGWNERESDDANRKSDFDGQTVRLEKADRDFKRLSDALFNANPNSTGCWRACPTYVLAFDAEIRRLRSIAPRGGPNYFIGFFQLQNLAPAERAYFEQSRK